MRNHTSFLTFLCAGWPRELQNDPGFFRTAALWVGNLGTVHSGDPARDARKTVSTGGRGQREAFWDRPCDCHFPLLCSKLLLRNMFCTPAGNKGVINQDQLQRPINL